MSVLDYMTFGSCVSIRGLMRLATDLSVSGMNNPSDLINVVYNPLSCSTYVRMGSSLSLFGIMRLGASLSVLDMSGFGSSLSLRSFARLGSTLSVLDLVNLGASMSLRSLVRFGSTLSILGGARLGSCISVFDEARLQTGKVIKFTSGSPSPPWWQMNWDTATNKFDFSLNSAIPFSITPTGGSLHGTWSAESSISASDKGLKKNVRPLHEILNLAAKGGANQAATRTSGQESWGSRPLRQTASWLLRELQPVALAQSAVGSSTPSGRYRLGFDADQAERVVPSLVKEMPLGGKGINFQDLIAIITLASKERQQQLDAYEVKEESEAALIQDQEEELQALEKHLHSLTSRFQRLRQTEATMPMSPRFSRPLPLLI
jgi:hypothetical protein